MTSRRPPARGRGTKAGPPYHGVASLTVKFESQLISATRDKAGEVIAGDPQRISDVTDYWSFAREVTSRNPNWKLVATESAT